MTSTLMLRVMHTTCTALTPQCGDNVQGNVAAASYTAATLPQSGTKLRSAGSHVC